MNFKTSTLVILALGSLLIGSAHADITSGLVTYLNLNETNGLTAADSSGNGINGTLVNFPADNSEWTTNGRIAGALVGNTTSPTTEYISLPNTANLNFDTGLAFTLSAWVKGSIAGASQVSGAAIFCKGIGGTGEQFTVDLNSGKFRFYVRNSGGTVSQATSTLAPAAGTWYHIVAVFNASGTNRVMQFYVNGQLNFSLTPPTSLKANTHVVSIGNREGGAATGYNLPFKGTIDDVHIYNRALSASDIYELYASNGRAPIITTQPRNVSCYLNDTPVLAVGVDQANSIVPVSYQWQLNGTNLPGATAANLVLTNVQSAAAGTYSVSVSNVIGITVSSNAVLQVASLPAADITNSLVGYWTFDDAAGSTTAADSTANANTASLVNFTDPFACWTNGLIAGGLNFNGDATALNYVSIPDSAPLSFTNSLAFTLAAWVNGPVLQTNTASIIAKGTGNGGEQFTVDISGGRYRFYVRNATGTVFTATTSVGPNNTWQHLVAVVNATNGLMNFYVNGQLAGASAAPFSLLANTHEISVGSRQSASAAYNLPFTGTIDDVRLYNRDLTSADVQALYLTGGVFPPAFVSQPHGTSLYAGDNLKLSGLANGTVPLVYQWIKNGTNIIGATNTSLIFAPLQLGDAGDYTLAVTNAYGAITSSVAVVQVQAFDLTNALAGFWKFDDGSGSATAADASANGNTATLINFPDATSEWVTGRINGAVNFNSGAVNQYATIADSPSLNFQSNLAFTIAAWVRGPATQISGAGVLAKGVGALNEQYAVDVHTDLLTTPCYRFYVRNAAGTSIALPTTVTPNGQWQNLVATYDGSFGIMNFYVNGQLVASNTAAPSSLLADNNHEVTIGCREQNSTTGYNFGFVGAIDDVRIYNRALSVADVQTLFSAAGGLPPVFYTQPQGGSKYVGDNFLLSAFVDGTSPLAYQWQKDGANVSGATASSLAFTNLQVSDAGNYTLVVTNNYGAATSSVAAVQVTLFSITNTFAYWKFDDGSGTIAVDASGNGNTGTLLNFPGDNSEWVAGRVNGGLNFNPGGVGQNVVTAPDSPSLNYSNSLSFSLAAWVKGPAKQIAGAGIIAKGYGGNEEYAIDMSGGFYRFYVRSAANVSSPIVGSVAPNNRWQHLIATYDSASGFMNLYVNGQVAATGPAPTSLLVNAHEVSIGAREQNASSGYNFLFAGAIDDVRFYNHALRTNEVQALYSTAGTLPLVFYTQPQNTSAYVGDNVTFSALADGADPFGYQWKKNGSNVPGATNSSLTVNNVQLGDNGTGYTLLITNASGSLLSSSATLSVVSVPAPDLTNNLIALWAFDETNGIAAADSSGNGNSATLYNFPGDDSQWTAGQIGGALHFNSGGANNQFVGVNNPLTLQNGNQFTFGFWAKRDAGATGVNPRIISPIGTQSWVLWSPGKGVGLSPVAVSTELSSNNWHHFVVVLDRVAGTYSLYVDGARQVTNAGGYSLTDPNALYWIIGHSENGGSSADSFNGLLDDIRVYNRLFNPNDAKALYYTGAQPAMSVAYTGGSIAISWPTAALGFHLQSATALTETGTVWTDVAATPVVSADGFTQTVNQAAGAGAKFYRLKNP